jgi:hypothetical protein
MSDVGTAGTDQYSEAGGANTGPPGFCVLALAAATAVATVAAQGEIMTNHRPATASAIA